LSSTKEGIDDRTELLWGLIFLHISLMSLLEQSEYFFNFIAEWMTTLEIKQDVNVTELDGIV
jgi:hypothetical protein